MLDVYELDYLEKEITDRLSGALTLLNRTDRLGELLELLGMEEFLETEPEFERFVATGKIVIIGGSKANIDQLIGVAKGFGIDKSRLEFCLDYKDAKSFDFKKTQWNPNYLLIMVGPIPHSTKSKGDSSSAIAMMEAADGYPPVIRLGKNDLKITKSDFREKLAYAVQSGYVA